MKACIKILFLVIGMVTTNVVNAQTTVNTSIEVNTEEFSEINVTDVYTVINRLGYSDLVIGFDQTGQIFEKEFDVIPGSDEFGTTIESASGNFAIVRDYYTDAHGLGYGLYYRNPDDTWTRVRSYGQVSAHFSVLTIAEEVIVTLSTYEDSRLGNTLVGDTYGGQYGDIGSNFAVVTENSTVVHKINSTGEISAFDVIVYDESSAIIEITSTASGVLLKTEEFTSGDVFYQLVNSMALINIWDSHNYPGAINVAVTELENGNFIFGVDYIGSDNDYLIQYDGDLLNPKISDDMEYPYGVASYPTLFANDSLCIIGITSSIVCAGSSDLDLRYTLNNSDFPGISGIVITSIDFENMTAELYGEYTGSDVTIAGTPLVDITDGNIGVVFATIDLAHSGEQIILNSDDADVLEVFNSHERIETGSDEMISTVKHVSAIQVTEEYFAAIVPGSTVDSDLHNGLGADYTDYPTEWQIDAETGETFYVLASGRVDYSEVLYQKVICTTDDLFIPFVNTRPTISGLVDGILDVGSILANSDQEYLINASDIDGDVLTLIVDGDVVPTFNDEDMHAFFVDLDYEITDFTFDFWMFDGTENSDTATFVVDIEGFLTIINNVDTPEITVYPNPTVDHINIDGQFDRVQVYSASGSLINETKDSKIDFIDLPKGMYFLHIYSAGTMSVKIVVKQ